MRLVKSRKTTEIIDNAATGAAARTQRQAQGLGLREMARRMGLSATHLCDLELGRRGWSEALAKAYNKALGRKA